MTSATYNTAVTKFWPNKECGLWIASEKLNSMNGLELFFLSSPAIDDWVWGPGKTQNWRVKKSNLLGSSDAVWLSYDVALGKDLKDGDLTFEDQNGRSGAAQ